jgi:hypothetical protein
MLVSGKQLVILTRSIPVHTRAPGDFSDSESIFRVRSSPAAAAGVKTAAQVLSRHAALCQGFRSVNF